MKKSSKGLILLGTVAIAISMGGASQLTTKINRNIPEERMKAYNHKPTSILDNTFMNGNTKILPFIFDNAKQTVTVETIKSEFKKANLTVKKISTDKITTGTTITVEENADVYTVLIYGDANGDGKVNLSDAQRVIAYFISKDKTLIQGIYKNAANVVNNNDSINLTDAQRIIQFHFNNLNVGFVYEEPESIKEAPVITLKGNNPQIIKYGASYSDAGATAVDKDGKPVTVQSTGTINTSKLGEQYITYTATSAKGNKVTKRRTVIVKDYATKVEITKQPKTSYKVGDALDLTEGEITITYASNTKQTIPMSRCTASGYSATAGSKIITLTYQDNALFEPVTTQFTVNVTEESIDPPTPITITGIRLDSSNIKKNYAEGDTISADGLKVYAKKSNNTEELVALSNVTINYSDTTAAESKTVTITVSYTTSNGTFTESCKVEIIVSKPISTIIASEILKAGIKYEEIEVTLHSGVGEADLVANDMDYTITKDKGEVSSGTIIRFSQSGSNVTMIFKTDETGTYTVTPKLKDGSVTGKMPITIDISKDNLEVTDIDFNIPTDTKFIAGSQEATLIPITFKHTYTGTTAYDEVDVKASDLYDKIKAQEGLDVELWQKPEGGPAAKIENPETSSSIVKYVGIKAANASGYSLSIAIGSGSISETIKVEEAKLEMKADLISVPVYLEYTETVTNVIKDEGKVFTLIGITLKENGIEKEIEEAKLHIRLRNEQGQDEELLPALFSKLYKANKIEATDGREIEYIGIAALSEELLNTAVGKKLVISYDELDEVISLDIVVAK